MFTAHTPTRLQVQHSAVNECVIASSCFYKLEQKLCVPSLVYGQRLVKAPRPPTDCSKAPTRQLERLSGSERNDSETSKQRGPPRLSRKP